MQTVSILVVEDDPDINDLLCTILRRQGYQVTGAFSGSEGRMCIAQYNYDLILLDLMLPGITGEELIGEIRATKTMPVIVVSAKTAQADKISLLRLGADDFIVKPFDVDEVAARVEAQLRRYKQFSSGSSSNLLRYKNLMLDRDAVEVSVSGQPVSFTAREFAILELLLRYPKKVFTRANLFEQVWEGEFLGDDNTVNVHISNLRSKLAKADPDTEYIKTVWGIGFKMAD